MVVDCCTACVLLYSFLLNIKIYYGVWYYSFALASRATVTYYNRSTTNNPMLKLSSTVPYFVPLSYPRLVLRLGAHPGWHSECIPDINASLLRSEQQRSSLLLLHLTIFDLLNECMSYHVSKSRRPHLRKWFRRSLCRNLARPVPRRELQGA